MVARISSAGTVAYYLADRQNSVKAMTDGDGTVQATLAYDAFGNITSNSNASFTDAYLYTGRERELAAPHLQYQRGNTYALDLSRWLAPDAWRIDANNPLRYVGNAPTNWTDPSGRTAIGSMVNAPMDADTTSAPMGAMSTGAAMIGNAAEPTAIFGGGQSDGLNTTFGQIYQAPMPGSSSQTSSGGVGVGNGNFNLFDHFFLVRAPGQNGTQSSGGTAPGADPGDVLAANGRSGVRVGFWNIDPFGLFFTIKAPGEDGTSSSDPVRRRTRADELVDLRIGKDGNGGSVLALVTSDKEGAIFSEINSRRRWLLEVQSEIANLNLLAAGELAKLMQLADNLRSDIATLQSAQRKMDLKLTPVQVGESVIRALSGQRQASEAINRALAKMSQILLGAGNPSIRPASYDRFGALATPEAALRSWTEYLAQQMIWLSSERQRVSDLMNLVPEHKLVGLLQLVAEDRQRKDDENSRQLYEDARTFMDAQRAAERAKYNGFELIVGGWGKQFSGNIQGTIHAIINLDETFAGAKKLWFEPETQRTFFNHIHGRFTDDRCENFGAWLADAPTLMNLLQLARTGFKGAKNGYGVLEEYHHSPSLVAPGTMEGMATHAVPPQFQRHVNQFINEWRAEPILDRYVRQRMQELGVRPGQIGIVDDVETGAAFSMEHGMGGRNTRPAWSGPNAGATSTGTTRGGINVDYAVFDPDFLPVPSWRTASLRDRIDAVIIHELMEYNSRAATTAMRHRSAILRSPSTTADISPGAKRILDEYRDLILQPRP